MALKQYWPQHKVYFYGQLAFLPEDLDHKALRKEKLRHYLPAESEDDPEPALRDFETQSFFNVEVIGKPNMPTLYMLTNINSPLIRKELAEYIEKIRSELSDELWESLWDAASKQYKQRAYQPIINWKDIYGDSSRYNYTPPFWEFVFTLAAADRVQIKKIAYTKTVPFLMKDDGSMRPMPEEMLPFYERPFVEFEILDKVLKQKISKPRSTIKYKITLQLSKRRKLQLIHGKKRDTIKEYRSVSSNTYRTTSTLFESHKALAKDELNLKPNTKSDLNDLLSNAGFEGILREVFIETNYDKERDCETVKLKRSKDVSENQYEQLLKYVQRKNTKEE